MLDWRQRKKSPLTTAYSIQAHGIYYDVWAKWNLDDQYRTKRETFLLTISENSFTRVCSCLLCSPSELRASLKSSMCSEVGTRPAFSICGIGVFYPKWELRFQWWDESNIWAAKAKIRQTMHTARAYQAFSNVRQISRISTSCFSFRKRTISPPCSSSNLFDRRVVEAYNIIAVILVHGIKDNTANVQIQPHTDGIWSNQYVVSRIGVVEKPSLLCASLRWKCTINDAALVWSSFFYLSFDTENIIPAESNNTITWLYL